MLITDFPGASSMNDPSRIKNEIFTRLREWQKQHTAGDGPRDPELEGLIYQFLYDNLRRIACVLPGMGPVAINQRRDVTCRFTSVLNDAFTEILEKCPTKLLRSQTLQQLTGFVSRTMVNMLIDHRRREGVWAKVSAVLQATASEDHSTRDILSHLFDERRPYFEERTGVNFESGLRQIQAWDNSTDPDAQQYAEILRKRYVDELSYDDIGREMGLSRAQVDNTLERARYQLRKLKTAGST